MLFAISFNGGTDRRLKDKTGNRESCPEAADVDNQRPAEASLKEQESDPRVCQIAKYLREKGISLWEEPYLQNGETNISQELVDSIARDCHMATDIILPILMQLQQHALERLEDKKLYTEQKLLTVRVKIGRTEHTIRIPETESSSKLFEEVAALSDSKLSSVRLVYQGKMLPNDSIPLYMHNVKQNSKMTALMVSKDVEASLAEEAALNRRKKDAEGTRKTASMAAAMGRCEITNQFGVKVTVPEQIRLELTAGLALSNKARTAIDKGKPHDALAFLLEAELLFNTVQEHSPDFLSSSGNIAQLQLDIVWCFLEIGSLAHFADAEKRLHLAESGLNSVYGANLEKVLKVKGNATNELTQLTRLQLLKGVAAFYKASYEESKACFEKANEYMKKLHVDEDRISQLVSLGYKTQEARLALRQANNNIELAMNLLLNKQEQRNLEQQRWEEEQKNKHLKGVNRALYQRLISDLGVAAHVARKALLDTGNDYRSAEALAIEMENERQAKKRRHEETVQNRSRSPTPSANSSSSTKSSSPKASHVAELMNMGESEKSAKYILEHFKGDLDAAQNFLLTGNDLQGSPLNKIISELRRLVSEDADEYLDSTLEKEMECFNTFMLRLAEIESASNGIDRG